MDNDRRIRIAITQGDTNGVGFELIFKAFEDPAMLELCTPIIYGSPKVASYYRKALESELSYTVINDAADARDGQLNLLAVIQEEVKVDMGQATTDSEEAAVKALAKAVADVRDGLADALVAGPVSEKGFGFKDLHFNTQTELVAQLMERHARKAQQVDEAEQDSQKTIEAIHPLRILTDGNLRMVVLSENNGLKQVAEQLTQERLESVAANLHTVLKRDLDVNNPRIAVLALNPRAGLAEQPGKEETEVIVPALAQLVKDGRQVFGPYSAELLLADPRLNRFDAVLAMHRDQVLAPFRLLTRGDGVVVSAGLPVVMTEPAHGACFEIAGKNVADVSAMRSAIFMAIDVARNRARFDEPLENPLPKLYHERKDESEKVRFRNNDRRNDNAKQPSASEQETNETES